MSSEEDNKFVIDPEEFNDPEAPSDENTAVDFSNEIAQAIEGAAASLDWGQNAISKASSVIQQVREEQLTAAAKFAAEMTRNYRGITARNIVMETGLYQGLMQTPVSEGIPDEVDRAALDLVDQYELADPRNQDDSDEEFGAAVEELQERTEEILQTPEVRFERVIHLLMNLLYHDEPGGVYYDYVDQVAPGEVPDTFRDRLARRLFETHEDLIARIEDYFETQCPEDVDTDSPLCEIWARDVWIWERWSEDGMLWLDKVGLEWLNEWTDGASLQSSLSDAQKKARDRWANQRDTANLLLFWVDPHEPIPWKLRPLNALAKHLWETEFRNEWERQQNPESATMDGVRYGDNQDAFAKLDKTAGAISTKGKLTRYTDEGAQPIEVDDASDLELGDDNERFTNASGVLRMIPQQWGVARDTENLDPSTTQLPLGIDPESEGASVAFRIFADSQVQLKPTAAKIVVGLHLLSPRNGGLGSVELSELTGWIYQDAARPEQKRNREAVRDNLVAARSLGVPPNLDGTGHNIQMFEIHPPDSLDKDAEVVFGHTRGFEEFLNRIENGEESFSQLRGKFILNADGFMRISGNDSDAARMYLTVCSICNDYGWDPERIPFLRIDELARRANQLSEQARRVLAEGAGDREQLRQGRSQTKTAIEKLIDQYELVGDLEIEGPEGRRRLKVVPNDRHREAWKHLRNNPDRRLGIDNS